MLYPYVRKSYLKAKGAAKSELRGKEEFVRVSWDTALDLAAKALKENLISMALRASTASATGGAVAAR